MVWDKPNGNTASLATLGLRPQTTAWGCRLCARAGATRAAGSSRDYDRPLLLLFHSFIKIEVIGVVKTAPSDNGCGNGTVIMGLPYDTKIGGRYYSTYIGTAIA